jgi:hypothetical protein
MFFHQRILGSGEFVEEVLLEAEESEKETLRLSRRVKGPDQLMREIAKGEGIVPFFVPFSWSREGQGGKVSCFPVIHFGVVE